MVDANAMSGSGQATSAFYQAPQGSTSSYSGFFIAFLAGTSQPFSFTGQLSYATPGGGSALSYASLRDVTTNTYIVQTTTLGAFSYSGTLTAGHQYQVDVHAGTGGPLSFASAASTAGYSFSFAVVGAAPTFPYEDSPH